MAGEPTRWVVVDDTDTGIEYVEPSWHSDVGSFDSAGNFGAPYQRTLHGTDVDASFSYLFNGTGIKVIGFNNFRNVSGVLDPSWECLVDDISIQLGTPYRFPEHNWLFCGSSQLPDGPHNLTVKVSVKTGQTFWFDEIMYAPSPSSSLFEKDVFVDNGDPMFDFDHGWQSFSAVSNMTQTTDSVITFNFTGASLTWYGFIPGDYPTSATTGTYVVDDRDPVTFVLQGLTTGSIITSYHQKFFETQQYPVGNHKMVVKYLGGSKVTPLVLDYIIINNRTNSLPSSPTTPQSPSPNSSNTSSTSPGATTDPLTSNRTATNKTGPIVGGAIGGIMLIIVSIIAALYLRKWERTQRKGTNAKNLPTEYIVDPFQYNPEAATAIMPPRPPPPTVERAQQKSSLSPMREAGLSSDGAMQMMHQEIIDRKRRLAMEAETRAAALRQSSPANSPSHSVSHSVGSTGSAPLIIHQDSGIRLSAAGVGVAVEIPPIYTVGGHK